MIIKHFSAKTACNQKKINKNKTLTDNTQKLPKNKVAVYQKKGRICHTSTFKGTNQKYQEAIRASLYDHELAYSQIHEKSNKKVGGKIYNISMLLSANALHSSFRICFLELWITTLLKTISKRHIFNLLNTSI